MNREVSLQCILRKLKQKKIFNENEYDKLYLSGSAPAHSYGTPKMYKFYSSDTFPKLRIVSSIGTFYYDLARFYLRYVDYILVPLEKEQNSFNFLKFLNNKHSNIKFSIEKKINFSIDFLDVLISGIDNQNVTL